MFNFHICQQINQQARAPVRKHKGGRFLWLGDCAKSTKTEEKLRNIKHGLCKVGGGKTSKK